MGIERIYLRKYLQETGKCAIFASRNLEIPKNYQPMKRIALLLLLSVFAFLLAQAQQKEFNGRVVDAETGDPLPYVTIYVSPGNGTLTNEEGNFMISAKDEENLRISCIGYKQVNLKVSDLPMIVKLQPFAKDLQEITVLPVPVRDVLSQTIKKLKKDSETGKLKGRMYFQRIVLSDSTETELVEMFTKSGSGLNLHEQRVIRLREDLSLCWMLNTRRTMSLPVMIAISYYHMFY